MSNPYVMLGAVVGAVVLAVSSYFYGEHVEGLDWRAKWESHEKALAQAHAKTTDEYREREHVLQDAIGLLDQRASADLRKANDENDQLRDAVDAGAQRLRVAVRCPTAPRVPQTAASAGVGAGTRAELDPDARPDYFALRSGLTRQEKKLAACQALLAAERENAR